MRQQLGRENRPASLPWNALGCSSLTGRNMEPKLSGWRDTCLMQIGKLPAYAIELGQPTTEINKFRDEEIGLGVIQVARSPGVWLWDKPCGGCVDFRHRIKFSLH